MQTLDECAVARVASHDFELITLGRFETKNPEESAASACRTKFYGGTV